MPMPWIIRYKNLKLVLFSFLVISLLSACQNIVTKQPNNRDNPEQNTTPGYRTKDSLVKDNQIEKSIRKFIRADQQLRKGNVRVMSYNQVVLLIGQLADKGLKQKLSAFLRKMKRVKIFHNKLEVSPNLTLLNTSSDWFMATRLNAKLLLSDVDTNRIYLTVNNNRVYLMGMLTRAEAKQVAQLIQESGNIKKIVLAFEYLD